MLRELRGLDYEGTASRARGVLSKTGRRLRKRACEFAPARGRRLADDATQADLGYLQKFTRFDHFFPRERMLGVYRELFAALGFNSEKQSNLAIDPESRPGKQSQAFCSPIRVPDEIKLSVNLTGGQANYRELLREAGRAQLYAWTSRNLYPEFRLGGDHAVVEAWGLPSRTWRSTSAGWMTTFGFVENMEFRRALAAQVDSAATTRGAARLRDRIPLGRPASGAGRVTPN